MNFAIGIIKHSTIARCIDKNTRGKEVDVLGAARCIAESDEMLLNVAIAVLEELGRSVKVKQMTVEYA